jgi:hypothetical protein
LRGILTIVVVGSFAALVALSYADKYGSGSLLAALLFFPLMFGGLSLCSSLPSPWNDRLFLFVAAFMPLVALLTVWVLAWWVGS